MTVKTAGVLEPDPVIRRALISGLKQAGLSARALPDAGEGARVGLVVLGPGVSRKAAEARRIRERHPQALVLQAQRRPEKAAHADGALPLPLSPADLRVRLPELVQLRALRRGSGAGEGPLDPRTAFYAYQYFKEVLFVEVKRARRHGFPLALALCAFDPMEARTREDLRDQLFGGLALAVRRSLRDTDYPVQVGPDRVLVLMPHTDLPAAVVVSQRICERVAKASLTSGDRVLRPTISIGVSAAPAHGQERSFEDLVAQAQGALERAMAAGGNQVESQGAAAREETSG
ncbi:MAG TPA: GGDEF domain-containing protein [Myxococcaceae bacterium]|jgi:diguanylate cyclase (GGDEF)-like protein